MSRAQAQAEQGMLFDPWLMSECLPSLTPSLVKSLGSYKSIKVSSLPM